MLLLAIFVQRCHSPNKFERGAGNHPESTGERVLVVGGGRWWMILMCSDVMFLSMIQKEIPFQFLWFSLAGKRGAKNGKQ